MYVANRLFAPPNTHTDASCGRRWIFLSLRIVSSSKENSLPGKRERSGEMTSSSTNSREIRRFGVVAFVFFGCLSILGFWSEKPIPTYLFGCLSILGFGFIFIPSRLSPVYAAWLRIAHFLGRIVNTLILTLAYYLVITPAAVIKRLFGGAPLPVKPDKEASSYWVVRTEPIQPKERFLKRY